MPLGGADDRVRPRGTVLAQLRVEQRVVIRVPTQPAAISALAPNKPVKWKEKKGPKCIALNRLRAAAVTTDDSIDLVLQNGARLRAKLNSSCPAIDFYQGFYLRPSADGLICSDRDSVRTRAGAVCEITRLRTLVAER